MRIGSNPNKQQNQLELTTHHRVIMVVFIPNESDFYSQSFDVFKLALQSLIQTQHRRSGITVINNGSISKVGAYLQELHEQGSIDQLISYRENIGKIDAIVGAARGAREPLITLADADVLFAESWQEQVEAVFQNIPNTGAVSPICMRYSALHATSSTMKAIVLKKLQYAIAPISSNFEANQRFLQSVNWPLDQPEEHEYPVISYQGFQAIMGAPHQVITIRREVFFATVPSEPALLRMGGNSIVKYVDYPVDAAGLYRLSTYGSFAYHMGNQVEEWMKQHFAALASYNSHQPEFLQLPAVKLKSSSYTEKKRYFWRKWFKRLYGLNYTESPVARKADN